MAEACSETKKEVLLGKTTAELKEVAKSLGMPNFTGGQISRWIYEKGVTSIDEMTNLSKANRERLAAAYCIGSMPPIDCQKSIDGTIKYLFPVRTTSENGSRHLFVETVFIPDKDRATLCVSCQVGCKMNCLFCQTGKQGFEGHLTTADILNQIYSLPERERLTNIVFMGQGEPMDNLDNVLHATHILTSEQGVAWSPKRITVSSVGIIDKLKRFLDESQCHVAVSLHNPFAAERLNIMPMQKAYPIANVVALLRQYDWSGQRRISFEYTMFKGLNDDTRHAAELVRLLKGLYCRVNLIRFHSSPDTPFKTASSQAMERFKDYLNSHGITCTIRASRGEDIMAACGLLAGQAKHSSKQ